MFFNCSSLITLTHDTNENIVKYYQANSGIHILKQQQKNIMHER